MKIKPFKIKTTLLALAITSSISINSFALSVPVKSIEITWQDSHGVLSAPSKEYLSFQSPSLKNKEILKSWLAGSIGVEEVFFAATHDKDNWIVPHWLKGSDKKSELYSIYLVLETEKLKKGIADGYIQSYFDLVRLSREDDYVLKVLNKLLKSNSKTVNIAQYVARDVGDTIKILVKYNNGEVSYDELKTASNKNKALKHVLNKPENSILPIQTVNVDFVFDKENSSLIDVNNELKSIYNDMDDLDKQIVVADTKLNGTLDQIGVELKSLSSDMDDFGKELEEAKKISLELDQVIADILNYKNSTSVIETKKEDKKEEIFTREEFKAFFTGLFN
jgi:hypothetical protein